jgi:Peptidase A4 family
VTKLVTAAAAIGLLLCSNIKADAVRVTRGWAGYVVRGAGTSFDQATASWTQPRVVCNRPGSSVAIWTGLGGARAGSRALEQVGTSADCSDRGLVSHSAWYQLFPAPPVDLPVAVQPGDMVQVSITVASRLVLVEFTNVSTGVTFSTEVSMRGEAETDSAEWIVEAPAACFTTCEQLPLADFGKVTFTDASTRVETHMGAIDDPAWSRVRLKMAPYRRWPLAAATRLSGGGSSFSVIGLRASRPT